MPPDAPQDFCTRRSMRRRMSWHRDLPADVVAALWNSPENLLRAGTCLQTKSRTTVARIDLDSRPYLLKFHHWAGAWKTLTKSLATSPNRRSFDDGVRLAAAGIPTPLPLACVDVRRGPFNVCSYLLTEFVEGPSLYRLMRFGQPDESTVDYIAQQVADIWQSLDDQRFCHNDLKPENLMIDHDDRVWLIDLENGRQYDDAKLLRRAQSEDAKRLLHVRSWQNNPRGAAQLRERLSATPAAQAIDGINSFDQPPHDSSSHENNTGLTAVIACRDQDAPIGECVEAARDYADEVLVADCTPNGQLAEALANRSDCRLFQTGPFGSDTIRQVVSAATQPWVLWLDSTERASSDLAKEIQTLLATDPSQSCFRIERRTLFCGHVIRFGGWQSDAPIRLVRRSTGPFPELSQTSGEANRPTLGQLRCTIENRIAAIEQLTATLEQSALADAATMHAQGQHPSLIRSLLHAPFAFLHSYIFKLGCLDGYAGLHLALLSANSVYVRYAKLWQLTREMPQPASDSSQPVVLKLLDLEATSAVDDPPGPPRRRHA